MTNKAIFLDRDDTLIEDAGYINNPDQVKLLDGVAEALIELKNMGYKLIVASNQSGVGRGIISENVLEQIHNRLEQSLAEKGAYLDRIYFCPYHPDAVIPKYRRESDWRKPAPGMLLAAAKEFDIELNQSWMVGNSARDIEAGQRAGCKTIRIDNPARRKPTEKNEPAPDYKGVNLKEAVNIIKKHLRSPGEPAVKAQTVSAIASQPATPIPYQPVPPPVSSEQSNQPAPPQLSQKAEAGENAPAQNTEQLLAAILEQMKNMRRANMFDEFSIMRLIAGIVQVIALFCLLISIWFLMGPAGRDNAVLVTLGFAAVLQLMALTFYIMQNPK